MLPTNVVSFMKKMVSNTEQQVNTNQFMTMSSANTSTGAGAIGRLRQTLQQAQESVSSRLQQNRAPPPTSDAGFTPTGSENAQNVNQSMPVEEKENQEAARPGSAGRCRVCVKAMKPDEFSKECTECFLQVCDDCASYSATSDGNEIKWRCSVCRRRGVAIIARGVQRGIETSEVLEGLGCTTIRKSPDNRRLQAGNRADSETEVLLLAPKPSDVRRHSDVPLRDILKFQSSISNATSQHDLGLGLSVAMPTERAKSSTELMNKDRESVMSGISVSVTPSSGENDVHSNNKEKPKGPVNPKTAAMKTRQRSYERGASEGALNLPVRGGRRASCDMRTVDSSAITNNNNNQTSGSDKSGADAEAPSGPGPGSQGGLSEKDLLHLQQKHQQYLQKQQGKQHQQHQQPQGDHERRKSMLPPSTQPQDSERRKSMQPQAHHQQQQHPSQHHQPQQPQDHERRKSMLPPSSQPQDLERRKSMQPQSQPSDLERRKSMQPQSPHQHQSKSQQQQQQHERKAPSDLAISSSEAQRRRSVQIYNSTTKQAPQPRSCASLDQEGLEMKQRQQHQQQHNHHHNPHHHEVKRQGSSQDGESIKIVIDDVDSTAAAIDNKKAQAAEAAEFRTRVVRLRRDPQDRGYQTRGFGLRVVGGCSVAGKPGNLRARVARVTPGSGADFAGIRRGDIVLTWNGIKLTNLTFEEVCKVMDTSGDSIEITIGSQDNEMPIATVPENEPSADWTEAENIGGDQYNPASPTRRHLPRLPTEGRIQLRLFNDEVHNTLEIAVANIAFGNDDCTTIDLNDVIITLRIGEKIANTRWNQCVLFTKVSPEDLFDSWLILELAKGPDFLGESHIDMGRVSLDDRPVWFPFSAKGSSSHRGSISQIINAGGGNTPPGARDIARKLRMRMAQGSQSQSEEQDDSSGQSSPCASSLLRPEVAWEVLGTLGPPSANLTSRSAPTSRRGSAQSDRLTIGLEVDDGTGRGSLPGTPLAMPRSLPPSRRGSFAVAVDQLIQSTRRGSVAYQQPRVPDMFIRHLPEIPDGGGPDPSMLRNRRNSAWNPREVGFDRRSQFERTDSLRAIQNQPRRTSEVVQSFRDVVFEARNRARKAQDEDNWRQHSPQWSDRP